MNGHLSRGLNEDQIRRLLLHYFRGGEKESSLWERFREELKGDVDLERTDSRE